MLNALYCTRLRFEILKFPFGIKLPDSVSYSNSNNISWIYITTEKQNLTIFRSSVKQETGRFFNTDIPWIHFGNLFLYFQKKKKKASSWRMKFEGKRTKTCISGFGSWVSDTGKHSALAQKSSRCDGYIYCSAFSCAVPVTSSKLQAINWTLSTLLVFPVYIPTNSLDELSADVPPCELRMSHTRTELSIDEDATRLLSGLKDRLVTLSVCPLRSLNKVPDAKSHSFTRWSSPADAKYLPFGEKASDSTGPRWPVKRRTDAPCWVLQSRTVLSVEPVAK